MTDNEQIIEVAKLDGWEFYPSKDNQYSGNAEPEYWKHEEQSSGVPIDETELPLYLTSHDAIVPVIEKWINNNIERTTLFIDALCWVVVAQRPPLASPPSYNFIWLLLRATPRQLCEALLRATNKWKD
jgi:hypothetical protein